MILECLVLGMLFINPMAGDDCNLYQHQHMYQEMHMAFGPESELVVDSYSAPNAGDGIPDGSGWEEDHFPEESGAPNSGDGISDGSGWEDEPGYSRGK